MREASPTLVPPEAGLFTVPTKAQTISKPHNYIPAEAQGADALPSLPWSVFPSGKGQTEGQARDEPTWGAHRTD